MLEQALVRFLPLFLIDGNLVTFIFGLLN